MEIDRLNEYDLIIPPISQSGNDFRVVINKHFVYAEDNGIERNDDLLFALIEIVTLNKLNAVGENLLRSGLSEKESDEFLERYIQVIQEVKSRFGHGLSAYKDWYRTGGYIITDSNEVRTQIVRFNRSSWSQSLDAQKADNRDRKAYGMMDGELDQKVIHDYLSYYADIMRSEMGMHRYPHTAIIVKPLSVRSGENVIPLGNLYLHFGTRLHKNKSFYQRLVNDILLVFYHQKGYQVLKELETRTTAEVQDRILTEEIKKFYPDFKNRPNFTNGNGGRSIKEYYTAYFSSEVTIEQFEQWAIEMCMTLLPLLLIIREESITESKKTDRFSLYLKENSLFKPSPISTLRRRDNIEGFEKIIKVREIIRMAVLVAEIPLSYVKGLLNDQGYEEEKGYEKDIHKRLYEYFYTDRLIPYSKSKSIESQQRMIENAQSNFEELLTSQYRSIASGLNSSQNQSDHLTKDHPLI